MEEYFKEKYWVKIIERHDSFMKTVMYGNKAVNIEDIDLVYRDITHQEEDWTYMSECEFCWHEEEKIRYKTIIDVKKEDLTEEQKIEQRKPAEDLILSLIK